MQKIPFSKDEMIRSGEPLQLRGNLRKPMNYSTPVDPKGNFLSAIRRGGAAWIPFVTDSQAVMPRILPDNVARASVNDLEEPLLGDLVGGRAGLPSSGT